MSKPSNVNLSIRLMANSASSMHPPSKRSNTKPISKLQTSIITHDSALRRASIFRKLRSLFSRLFNKRKYPKRRRRSPPVKKPVIYVFSPTDIDISIAVTLTQNMEFTAVDPEVPIQKLEPNGKRIQWDVHSNSNGNLMVRKTGRVLSSLFWEADLNLQNLAPPHQENIDSDSMKWDISDSNSVLLSVNEVTEYLKKALMSLGLHTEARKAFIKFWSPFFLKHRHIALRFVPQSEYSRVAPLEVTPQPDVVTRVVMLFKGVHDVDSWPSARRFASEDVSIWAEIVGVDITSILDHNLSGVLEWGAMELPP